MSAYKPTTQKEKIDYLIATDERKEHHISILQKDVKDLTKSVDDLINVITGNKYNKETGFIELHKEIKKNVDLLKHDVDSLKEFRSNLQPQFNIGKYVFLLFVVLSVASLWNNLISKKTDKNNTEITK